MKGERVVCERERERREPARERKKDREQAREWERARERERNQADRKDNRMYVPSNVTKFKGSSGKHRYEKVTVFVTVTCKKLSFFSYSYTIQVKVLTFQLHYKKYFSLFQLNIF